MTQANETDVLDLLHQLNNTNFTIDNLKLKNEFQILFNFQEGNSPTLAGLIALANLFDAPLDDVYLTADENSCVQGYIRKWYQPNEEDSE